MDHIGLADLQVPDAPVAFDQLKASARGFEGDLPVALVALADDEPLDGLRLGVVGVDADVEVFLVAEPQALQTETGLSFDHARLGLVPEPQDRSERELAQRDHRDRGERRPEQCRQHQALQRASRAEHRSELVRAAHGERGEQAREEGDERAHREEGERHPQREVQEHPAEEAPVLTQILEGLLGLHEIIDLRETLADQEQADHEQQREQVAREEAAQHVAVESIERSPHRCAGCRRSCRRESGDPARLRVG